jgi:hypothetical protein
MEKAAHVTLQDFGSIGELIGAVASVAMLGYLAIQVRQNTMQLREATSVAKTTNMDRTIETFSRYRHLLAQQENAELYARGLDSYAALDAAERIRFGAILQEYFFAYRGLQVRTLQGGYESASWAAQVAYAASILRTPGGAEWWVESRGIFDDEFAVEMERFAELGRSS